MKSSTFLLLLGLVLPVALLANHPSGDRDAPRVILYEHPHFGGGSIALRAGESLPNLARATFDNGRRANDRISSVRIEGGADVMLYTDATFQGGELRLSRDVHDLGRGAGRGGSRFSNQVSSVRVEARRNERGPARPTVVVRPLPAVDVDRLIQRSYRDVLEREPDAVGLRHYRAQIIDRGWSEKQLRDHLRASDEYRGPVVERTITRVYREVLGRAPDRSGLDHYRSQLVWHNWTEADIRKDLLRSNEYRARAPQQPPALADHHETEPDSLKDRRPQPNNGRHREVNRL
ncbi:MAG: DUF4214 domain-containing protein [Candidatus Didemnitutus sp.]|nr:DUF4214 domain-containing protein [Candidatus Didemnitutus sp.]